MRFKHLFACNSASPSQLALHAKHDVLPHASSLLPSMRAFDDGVKCLQEWLVSILPQKSHVCDSRNPLSF